MSIHWHVEPPFRGGCFPSDPAYFGELFHVAGEVVNESLISRVVRMTAGGRWFYVKVYWPRTKAKAGYYFGMAVRREWENLQRFHRLGIAAPVAVAWGHERRRGRFHRAAIITEAIESTEDLLSLQQRNDPRLQDPVWIDAVSRQVADYTRRLHGEGFIHMDLKWRNILVTADRSPKVWFIDCPAGRVAWPFQKERGVVKDLGCLDKVGKMALSRSRRLRFYLHYRGVRRLTPADKVMIRRILSFFQGRE